MGSQDHEGDRGCKSGGYVSVCLSQVSSHSLTGARRTARYTTASTIRWSNPLTRTMWGMRSEHQRCVRKVREKVLPDGVEDGEMPVSGLRLGRYLRGGRKWERRKIHRQEVQLQRGQARPSRAGLSVLSLTRSSTLIPEGHGDGSSYAVRLKRNACPAKCATPSPDFNVIMVSLFMKTPHLSLRSMNP